MEAIGGRKVVVSLAVLIVGIAVTIIKGDIPQNLLQLLEVIGVGYVAGNVGVKIFGKNFAPTEEVAPKQEIAVNLPEPTEAAVQEEPKAVVPPQIQFVINKQAVFEEKINALENSIKTISNIILEAQNAARKVQ